MHRHEALEWAEVKTRLQDHPEKLRALHEMEESGGEPDVVGHDATSVEPFSGIAVMVTFSSITTERSLTTALGASEEFSVFEHG